MSIHATISSFRRIQALAIPLNFGVSIPRKMHDPVLGRSPLGAIGEAEVLILHAPTVASDMEGQTIKLSQLAGEYSISPKGLSNCIMYLTRFTVFSGGKLVRDMLTVDGYYEAPSQSVETNLYLSGLPIECGDWTIEAMGINEFGEISQPSPKVRFTVVN